MEISSTTIHNLTDSVINNRRATEALEREMKIQNLLKLYELKLITKEQLYADNSFQEYFNNLHKVENKTIQAETIKRF